MLRLSSIIKLAGSTAARRGSLRRATGGSRGSSARRNYHTYPDPEDQGITTSARSEVQKTVVKDGNEFQAVRRFDVSKPFDIPSNVQTTPLTEQPKTMITKLPNGLTVATQDMPGIMCSIALLVKSGSTSEDQGGGPSDDTGAAHMVELTAFGDTATRTQEELHAEVEQLGGIVQCVAQRECISYFMDVLKPSLEAAVDILAESVLRPQLTEEEVSGGKDAMMFLRESVQPEILSKDAVVIAAYGGSPLGNTLYCPADKIDLLTREKIMAFRNKFFVPENCIISASAVEHETFVKLIEKVLSKYDSIFQSKGNSRLKALQKSFYVGGMVTEKRTLRDKFVRCTVCFEVGGWSGKNFVTACVLQSLLGGGSSFSAGGPGKGMYTRLYREILNKYGWVESAEAVFLAFNDVGLLGIDGSTTVEGVGSMLQVFIDQLLRLSVEEVTDEELSRAKNMLKSMMFMQLESRLITCEDIGKQVMVYGERKDAAYLCDQIDNVSKSDIIQLALSMFQNDPAIAVIGHDVSTAPTFDAVKHFVNSYKSELWGQKKASIMK